MQTIYKIARGDYDSYIAVVLESKSNTPTTTVPMETLDECVDLVKRFYGEDAQRMINPDFEDELRRRSLHTEEMLELLRNNPEGDLSEYYVYGSAMRPMGSWARIDRAVFIAADKRATGYHTFVAVPNKLQKEVIERFELSFVSRSF